MAIPEIRMYRRELQDKFNSNEGGYPLRLNELDRVCTYNELASLKSNQLPGTRSMVDKFFDEGVLVMVVHYFRRPDGTLGGSGKYDPKKLLVNGTMYWAP